MRRARVLSAVAITLFLAACSDSIAPPNEGELATLKPRNAPPTFALTGESGPMLGVIHPSTPEWMAADAAPDTQRIRYHGGPVATTGLKIVAIYWSSSRIYTNGPTPGSHGAGTGDASLVGYFLRNLGASPYYNINTTYTQSNGMAVTPSVTYTKYWAYNTAPTLNHDTLKVSRVYTMLVNALNAGTLTFDARTLYVVFTGPNVNLGGGFGTEYCAYHTWLGLTVNGVSKKMLWAAMPYTGNNAHCHVNFANDPPPNANTGGDAEANVLAHEIEETATDMYGDAWTDASGDENADKCAWYFGPRSTTSTGGHYNITVGTKRFLVQENWIRSGGCKKTH